MKYNEYNFKNTANITHQIQTIVGSPISILDIHIQRKVYRNKFVLKRVFSPRRNLICLYVKLHIICFFILTNIKKCWFVLKLVDAYFTLRPNRIRWIELARLNFWYPLYSVVSIICGMKLVIVQHDLNLSVVYIAFWPLKHFFELCLIFEVFNQTSFILIEFSPLLWNTRSVNDW